MFLYKEIYFPEDCFFAAVENAAFLNNTYKYMHNKIEVNNF